ncbi:MAG: S-methyl-5'-thioinosine phosphorylase [Gammaproteobacteria bacterium]|nr:S-methyl-5'-thioinosine phosphorylase [Gammaproteobacteria bacterium]
MSTKNYTIAVIGGTGLNQIENFEIERREVVHTPYGRPSAPLVHGCLNNIPIVFLARHGSGHRIPPHHINYRANIWALKHAGVSQIVAIAAVGGINADMPVGTLVIPEQIIDYTSMRKHTFFEGNDIDHVTHIDFSYPYCPNLRAALIKAADAASVPYYNGGTYGATQGPRLETAAEINRMERDGCDLVGMTGMPEAALAKELEMHYVTCAVIANRAAGRGDQTITMRDIEQNLVSGMVYVRKLLGQMVTTPCDINL